MTPSHPAFPDHPCISLPPLRETIAAHGLMARKSLGQNFLFDLNLTGRIARNGGDLGTGTTIEIGPGPGGLTRALLDNGARQVIAVERDPRMLPVQEEIAAAYPGRLNVMQADALEIPVHTLGTAPRRVVANLPYNIATPLILQWLQHISAFECLVVMLQKEVVDRLAARPRTPDYGRLTIITQWLCTVEPLFDVNPRAFIPPPKVTSTVVRLVPRPAPLAPCRFDLLEAVTAAAFNQRRKMLRSSLKTLASRLPDRMTAEDMCTAVGVIPTARAEELDITQFCALANLLEHTNA